VYNFTLSAQRKKTQRCAKYYFSAVYIFAGFAVSLAFFA